MNIFKICLISISIILINACCFKKQVSLSINIKYSNILNQEQLYIYIKQENDNWEFLKVETLTLEKNNFNSFAEGEIDHLLILGDSVRIDSITDIYFERKGRCNNTIKNFQFKHNGILKTDRNLILN